MAVSQAVTVADVIDVLEDTIRMNGAGASLGSSALKRCVMTAYEEFAMLRKWRFLQQTYRLQLRAPYATGTMTYKYTGDAYDREVVITGGTWPSWIVDGSLYLGGVLCQVEELKTSTTLTLSADTLPSDTTITDAAVKVIPNWYLLPADYLSVNTVTIGGGRASLRYVDPVDMLLQSAGRYTSGTVRDYTIGAAQGIYGRMAMQVYPYPADDTTLDLNYGRSMRPLQHSGKALGDMVGTVSVSGATVTGTSTLFTNSMVGSVIRFNALSTTAGTPTGWTGDNPAAYEASVLSVTSATELILDSAIDTLTGVRYSVSDPLDAPPVFIQAIVKMAELNLARRLAIKNSTAYDRAAHDAIRTAKRVDGGMVNVPVIAGGARGGRIRLHDIDSNS